MQEDVEMKTVMLVINGSKLTGRTLKSAIQKLLAHMRDHSRRDVTPHGKQTVKQLLQKDQGASTIEINDPSIKDFERIARKYGVDYAIKKCKGDKPKYMVFFKGRDADALTAAFSEYTDKRVKRQERPSVLKVLHKLMAATRRQSQPTGKHMTSHEIHCHHKVPVSDGGTDAYANLVLVTADVHRLIHATQDDTISSLLKKLNLDQTQLAKLNKLRQQANLSPIDN